MQLLYISNAIRFFESELFLKPIITAGSDDLNVSYSNCFINAFIYTNLAATSSAELSESIVVY